MGNLPVPDAAWTDDEVAALNHAHQWMFLADRGVAAAALHAIGARRQAWNAAVASFCTVAEAAAIDRNAARRLPSKRRRLQQLSRQIDETAMNALKMPADGHDKAA